MSCSWPLLNNSAFSEVKETDANTRNCQPCILLRVFFIFHDFRT
jgi:hypothetical protein